MSRQAEPYEKILLDIIKEYNNRFYYDSIFRVVDHNLFKIKVEKAKEEMVGRASVTFPNSDRIDYEFRFNRIINLCENYTLLVSGTKTG